MNKDAFMDKHKFCSRFVECAGYLFALNYEGPRFEGEWYCEEAILVDEEERAAWWLPEEIPQTEKELIYKTWPTILKIMEQERRDSFAP
jgi:hypothetical protein